MFQDDCIGHNTSCFSIFGVKLLNKTYILALIIIVEINYEIVIKGWWFCQGYILCDFKNFNSSLSHHTLLPSDHGDVLEFWHTCANYYILYVHDVLIIDHLILKNLLYILDTKKLNCHFFT